MTDLPVPPVTVSEADTVQNLLNEIGKLSNQVLAFNDALDTMRERFTEELNNHNETANKLRAANRQIKQLQEAAQQRSEMLSSTSAQALAAPPDSTKPLITKPEAPAAP